MATLQSPGVSISVIDESFYTPAGAGTVPMIFVATGQDKQNGAGTGTAQGTTAANAGKVWVITSQRDLTDTFGTPYFETDAEGNPVNGGELNEYGLQAAYSLLGVTSKAYIVRADVNTSALYPDADVPGGNPVTGTYWLDTADTHFGINEWNSATKKFTVKTPAIIDSTNASSVLDSNNDYAPIALFGVVGSYAIVVTNDNSMNALWYKSAINGWIPVENTFDGGKKLVMSPHYDYPDFTPTGLNAGTGSVWVKTTSPARGSLWDVKVYNASTAHWNTVNAPLYKSTQAALAGLDPLTGGSTIPLGTVLVQYDVDSGANVTHAMANFKLWIRYKSTPTTVSVASNHIENGETKFKIRETREDGTWGSYTELTCAASMTAKLGSLMASAINSNINLVNTSAAWDANISRLTITHKLGGDIEIVNTEGQATALIGLLPDGSIPGAYLPPANDLLNPDVLLSNWKPLVYESQPTAPKTIPADGTLWFDAGLDVDIMYNNGTHWEGYINAFPATDPDGPLVMASMPMDGDRSDGASLAAGDIWINTSEPDLYGQNIYVYDGSQWVQQDVTDHVTPDGWVYGDARWSDNGHDNTEYVTPIADMLVSNYVDPDCPDPRLYPRGTRLFNTRRSGNNIKKYHSNYINVTEVNHRYNDENMIDYFADRWVTASPNDINEVGQFGRLAQRSVVIKGLKAQITANQSIRDTDTLVFNLIATPGYPEAIQDMVAFNTDIGLTAMVIGDTPFRLPANGTDLTSYGMNTPLAADNNDVAAVTYDTNLAMFYPSGYTTDNLGNNIVVPPSHMMMRTIVNSDAKSYLWFAPAGTRRGTIDNASSVGYVEAQTGEFKTASLHQGLRDVMAGVKINPIATLPGAGLVNMGQYTRAQNASALDRINVSRLIGYLRRQLSILAKPFLFEPNDSQTRHEVKSAVDSLLTELVSQRALYDFLVVCDTTNNTPTRIDRSELWVDIAIEPVKAVEFIYIPLRILNTGAIAKLNK